MTTGARRALAALRFNYAQAAEDVWRPSPFHVESLHRHTARLILDGLIEAEESDGASPIGIVVQGQRGSGKTHLLGWVRQKAHEEDAYFFLVSLLDARDFWQSVLLSMLDSLSRPILGSQSQLKELLWRLCVLTGVSADVRPAVIGDAPLVKDALDDFVAALRRYDRLVGGDAQDVARALVLRASRDLTAQDVGDAYLASASEGEPGERAAWGLRTVEKSPQEIVRDLSRLVALTGPSVIAVDQIDTLIAQSGMSTDGRGDGSPWRRTVEQVAGGLMTLREVTHRTLTVVCSLPATWVLIKTQATDTAQDRFRESSPLKTIPDAATGITLIEKRFAVQYGAAGFDPPYPTWPVRSEAFEEAYQYTPRQLLKRIDTHVRSCLAGAEITELQRLSEQDVPPLPDLPPPVPAVADLAALDALFARAREEANVAGALGPATEDAEMPPLLSAGLAAWILEHGEAGRVFSQDAAPSARPPLHARLRRTLDEGIEDEAHWCFRAVAATNALAALTRLRNASVAAGLDAAVPKRRLFVLRNQAWARGPRTQEALAAFEQAGGRVLQIEEEDLKIFAALRRLQAADPPNLQAWLAARKPTAEVKLFREALGDAGMPPPAQPDPAEGRTEPPDGDRTGRPGPGTEADERTAASRTAARTRATTAVAQAARPASATANVARTRGVPGRGAASPFQKAPPSSGMAVEDEAPFVTIGATIADGEPVRVRLEALRRHTAIFAGSGSGKTVLIRRLIEECALQGVSTIALDPNNDLARLGEAWPEPPDRWGPGDAARADDYLAGTDVVVWTPGRESGRPLSFQPLPDFASVLDDPDEFTEAVDAAVTALVPRAKLEGRTSKAHLGQAVLREAVEHYGRRGMTGLTRLIALLDDLPDGVSTIEGASKIASDIAQNLQAAVVMDPLFAGRGTPVDPGVLLTPPDGRRARVSVINLAGLPSDAQRQSFVNQLQLALFAWIKRNPAGDRPLGGLFVMDEAQTFAPSGAMTACTRSTLALAAQARKYGLGLVFATQAPKGLHNGIPGNASTQFFGLLNAPVHITAAREMAKAKGSDVADVARLRSGQFYAAVEGARFRKLQAPLCLSHHPRSPLTTEEVLARATGSS
ncbi:ATP-binding protein [Microbispora sp. ATCC PTA-5024]|uniref:ATP-binding protein n=1 Tax=Microbispora sp. ATCC PTA-5024 TaxID=316330 RepID=UPI0003DD4DE8|nr:ATP-binding protein [Microbispora sp. ATCC PTA-5024]ETK31500.1 hypothetical protein MPTA5024_34795 [Microbispora sp. ATCC PTA-5024]